MSDAILQIRDVGMQFGGLAALRGVTFDVMGGTIHSVIGPNGAGKTTLLNAMSALYRPTSGRVLFGGRDVGTLPPYRMVQLGMARTFQGVRLSARMTVLDNVLLGAHHLRPPRAIGTLLRTPAFRTAEEAGVADARVLLRQFGLEAYETRLAGSLPFGLQRLTELARALAARPRVLLLDEPASGLVATEVQALIRHLVALRNAAGLTIVLVEHSMDVVMQVSDRIVVLNFGERLAEGTPQQICDHPGVVQAYLGAGEGWERELARGAGRGSR